MKGFFYILAVFSLFSCTALNEEEWRYDDAGSSSSGSGLYCDYGPVTQYGGGCFEINNASECDAWGQVVYSCAMVAQKTIGDQK